jgi:hypothetical protein
LKEIISNASQLVEESSDINNEAKAGQKILVNNF